MPTSTRTKLDLNQLAKRIADQAIGDAPKVDAARKVAGRKGGTVGGKKRMEALTEAQRLELSARGVAARKKAPASSEAGAGKVTKSGR